ncbi:Rne/Rng family ribonuclease [Ghiorsea bivora]|uniref:Rne/Rng family ribonuclease n=1 Tax=Ghiorsea bivora TaxID=1485545 RepID=UPI000A638BF3|nr:Rne/Rng family ribonuclease [Ghiorsea bivora]
MKKLMLINASHEEESRVAIVEDDFLQELDIESTHKVLTKGNIYKGTITKVEASLQAAFVEYGALRQGFMPLSEIHPDYWKDGVDKTQDPRNVNIQDVLEPKQSVLVQVVKEERGNKGAALTTYLSLAGRYLVLSPNTERGGISRKLPEDVRRALKEILSQLNVPDNMGLIVRTAGRDQKLEALERDYSYLQRLWDEIRIKSGTAPSPSLIYLEGDMATRAIRDHFSDDIHEIWVDNHEVYTRTKNFVHAVLPGKEKLVKLYRGKKPIFRQYGIESQCEQIHEREIRLPSGGSIVFDPTEALTAVDVNSSRSTGRKHIDDTALDTNLEAAREIARQLRIRDIGGLVVVDFIDMANRKHGQQVEEELRSATAADKARVQFARISRFGLLEMSRQRLHPSVRETTTETCPRCQGRGSILTVESMALQMLTRMEDLAEKGKKPKLVVQVPSETGEYLMNNKRDYIARIEENHDVQISLQIRPDLMIPHYRIERHWRDDNQDRLEMLEDTMKGKKPQRVARKLKPMKPVVGIPQPIVKAVKVGWFKALLDKLFGEKKEDKPEVKHKNTSRKRKRTPNRTKKNKPAVKVDVKQEKPTKTEGEEGQKRRRRRRRRPAKDKAGQQQGAQQQNDQTQNNQQQNNQKKNNTAAAQPKKEPSTTTEV